MYVVYPQFVFFFFYDWTFSLALNFHLDAVKMYFKGIDTDRLEVKVWKKIL